MDSLRSSRSSRFWCQATALVLALTAFSSAQALTNPPIRLAQGIEYMCGGQSAEEAAFMQTVAPRWAASLEFVVGRAKAGEAAVGFPGEIKVAVRERYTGRPVMQAATVSRYMLARLDPGAYEIEATLAGITLQQPLVVFNGVASSASFVWPSNVDFVGAASAGRPAEQQAVARLPQ